MTAIAEIESVIENPVSVEVKELAALDFKKMNLGQSYEAGQVGLGGITSNEYLGADMLGGGNVDKIPCARMRVLGVAGA
jgi:hypothetical protein